MRIIIITLCVCSFLASVSCEKKIAKEGYVNVEGGKIWYKIVGEGKGIPLLVLHGGPGSLSCPMIPAFSRLANERPVIFYDQLGSGNSDRPTDTSLWKIDRFVNEITLLRNELELEEVHILGHSCGSTFLIEYMISQRPKGVKSVIFSSPMLSTKDWIADANLLLSELPTSIRDTISKYEALKDYTSPIYLAATDSFYIRHLSLKGWPPKTNSECEQVPKPYFNTQVYNYMWGPTEFTATGTLIDFDRTSSLDQISEPILFLAGEHDEARPETIYRYQKLAQNAAVEIIENAAHSTYNDQPQKVTEVIRGFLKNIEGD
ncbi:proline iminopeptidase-family hydrolase [Portibacter lacus]|uniref:Proline iminopeptidase n=1 Tax=Portibacter lacus TaxID=1099794 RepID=A0AA37WGI5_9BACT|nr:proline iminopeptidase-family hydrolase [Portibacter lacus]GLR19902.1 proline iminopeptidase [Portibacter lacus]